MRNREYMSVTWLTSQSEMGPYFSSASSRRLRQSFTACWMSSSVAFQVSAVKGFLVGSKEGLPVGRGVASWCERKTF